MERSTKVYRFTKEELIKSNLILTNLISQKRLTERELDALLVARDCIYSVFSDNYIVEKNNA